MRIPLQTLLPWLFLPAMALAQVATPIRLMDRVYWMPSDRGNVGLVVTERGAVLIDGQAASDVPALLMAVRTLTHKPIRYLVNSHAGPEDAAANALLAPQVGTVLAHFNAQARMKRAGVKAGLPEVGVGVADPNQKTLVALDLGDTEIHLFHLKAGHTDGDLIMGLPELHVMHLGNLFWNGLTPKIETARGGSLDGLLSTIESILSWLPEDNWVIPGHGPVGTKRDLARYRDFLQAAQAHVKAHPGMRGEALDATFDHAAWHDFRDLGPLQTWAQFFEQIASLNRPQRSLP